MDRGTAEASGRRPPAADRRERTPAQTVREAAFLVICGLCFSLAAKTLLFQLFLVPSESMDPTLRVGDKIAAFRLWPRPIPLGRGDIVVFRDPANWLHGSAPASRGGLTGALEFIGLIPRNSGSHLVKRVVGIGGDVVECTAAARIRVNGENADESYLQADAHDCGRPFKVVVPEHCLWVMGDNRDNSADSRFNTGDRYGGCVPESAVVGRVLLTIWPPTSIGTP